MTAHHDQIRLTRSGFGQNLTRNAALAYVDVNGETRRGSRISEATKLGLVGLGIFGVSHLQDVQVCSVAFGQPDGISEGTGTDIRLIDGTKDGGEMSHGVPASSMAALKKTSGLASARRAP
jgi:hypothetical protein